MVIWLEGALSPVRGRGRVRVGVRVRVLRLEEALNPTLSFALMMACVHSFEFGFNS